MTTTKRAGLKVQKQHFWAVFLLFSPIFAFKSVHIFKVSFLRKNFAFSPQFWCFHRISRPGGNFPVLDKNIWSLRCTTRGGGAQATAPAGAARAAGHCSYKSSRSIFEQRDCSHIAFITPLAHDRKIAQLWPPQL